MLSTSQQSVLVVVEGDAACPFWMEHWGAEPTDDWSMLEQEEWETTPGFMRRLEDTLARVADPELTVVFVTGMRNDPMALASRWELASSLMAHLAQHGGARLVLTRGFGQSRQSAGILAELADDLSDAFEEAAEVVVRLAEQMQSSEIRTWAPPRSAAAEHYGVAAAE